MTTNQTHKRYITFHFFQRTCASAHVLWKKWNISMFKRIYERKRTLRRFFKLMLKASHLLVEKLTTWTFPSPPSNNYYDYVMNLAVRNRFVIVKRLCQPAGLVLTIAITHAHALNLWQVSRQPFLAYVGMFKTWYFKSVIR